MIRWPGRKVGYSLWEFPGASRNCMVLCYSGQVMFGSNNDHSSSGPKGVNNKQLLPPKLYFLNEEFTYNKGKI